MKRIYIILKEDIIDFPPILSILRVLNQIGYETIHMGTYSDNEGRKELEEKGVRFISLPKYDGKKGLLSKFKMQYNFRKQVKKRLKSENVTRQDILWIPQIETITLLHKLVFNYTVILHPLEFTNPNVSWKYRMISPSIDLEKSFKAAKAIVCCEYNRAHITKGIYSLERLPFILPNKPYIDDASIKEIPTSLKKEITQIKDKIKNKKVILYQGIFLDKERRLEEFCEAMSLLPEDFILIAMGRGGSLFENLKLKYQNDRILFIPFIRPPYHLLITQEAYIGVLSYFPRPYNIGSVINPLYCAPNKIYEYSKFGKPMIANDIPGLHYIFKEFHCGECVSYPVTPENIANQITSISQDYSSYEDGSKRFYEDVKIEDIIKNIVDSIQ